MITASQAIKRECHWCIGTSQAQCTTKVCKLHPGVSELRSRVKRIREHCLDCAAQDIGETKYKAADTCTGRLLCENGNEVRWVDSAGVERGVCYLHPYRFGKNPNRVSHTRKMPTPPAARDSKGRLKSIKKSKT
jgi:hypothetical protein